MNAPIYSADTSSWMYPPQWSDAQRVQWEAATGQLIHEKREGARVDAAVDTLLSSPEMIIAAKRIEVDEAKRARETAERRGKGEAAWLLERARLGATIDRLDTVEGDVIIVATMTTDEIESADEAAQRLLDAARATVGAKATEKEKLDAEMRGLKEYAAKQHDRLLLKCSVGGLDAKASGERLRDLTKRYPTLFPLLRSIRNKLINGQRSDEEKDSAP